MSTSYHAHSEHDHGHASHDDDHAVNHEQHRHAHAHGLSGQAARAASSRSLRLALAVTLGYAFVEAAGGVWSGSLALLSDAGHMLTDSMALLLAVLMARVSQKPASSRHSFGLGRAEVVGAFVNGLFMLGVIVYIAVEAVARVLEPLPVKGGSVMAIALVGLAVNVLVAWVLSRGAHSLNARAALLHVMGDLLGSVAAIVAGAVIYFTGWTLVDPMLSVLVALLILNSTWRLLRQSLLVLMEGVPAHLDFNKVGRALASVPGVLSVHDLHIWTMSAERVALSAHLRVDAPGDWPRVLAECQRKLSGRFGIDHITLQPEWPLPPPGGRAVRVAVRASEGS
ncbi:cation diffusion facilitator family transporter [Crenobacter luteus]|uniref:Cation transporter n=1 Tax=Crenobacter luteus TaxID=1452487 RepID=A0A161SAM1_9NEIS|nr:cation diffusion facilitator family transporter [Crenobacter luteus]KZE32833.1 cation transporter [Crenobacter luteus]